MTMPPAESYPAPSPSPDQFHGESPTSPLNRNPPSHDSGIPINDFGTSSLTPLPPLPISSGQLQRVPPPPTSSAAGGTNMVGRNMGWLSRRNHRRASYPTPLKQCFDQLELWKVCAMFSAMFGSMATFVGLKLISKDFMQVLLALLIAGTLCFMVALTMQDMLPELAVAAMLTGIGLVIALFHVAGFKLLHLSDKLFRLAVSLFVLVYSILLVLTLFQLFKEDVREKEGTEEDRSGANNV